MSKREIVQDGTPVLRAKAQPVPKDLFGSAELERLIADMGALLDAEQDGVALAAPQVNSPYRLFIVRKDRTLNAPLRGASGEPAPSRQTQGLEARRPPATAPEVEVYVNPEIVKTSRKRAKVEEGCLSVRGVYGTTKRHERVTIRAQRPDGTHFTRGAGGLLAQIFEHEIDHLNGILFTDHAEHLIHIPHGPVQPFAYFGSPSVSADTLELLLEHGYRPAVVVTSLDARRGRGMELTPTETRVLAEALEVPAITPEKLDAEAIEHIKTFGCEYAVVVAYGKIFPEALIRSFPKGVLNIHYSLLPKYRGATPLEAALLAGDTNTGVTIQKMAKELDAGDVLAQEAIPVAPEDTAASLRPRLVALGAKLLAETLPSYLKGGIVPVPQDAKKASYAPKRKKEDGQLALTDAAKVNWAKYRAYNDTIGTYFFDSCKRIKITKAIFKNGKFSIERVIPEGKREMAYVNASKQ